MPGERPIPGGTANFQIILVLAIGFGRESFGDVPAEPWISLGRHSAAEASRYGYNRPDDCDYENDTDDEDDLVKADLPEWARAGLAAGECVERREN